jgi:hypothetical protein
MKKKLLHSLTANRRQTGRWVLSRFLLSVLAAVCMSTTAFAQNFEFEAG